MVDTDLVAVGGGRAVGAQLYVKFVLRRDVVDIVVGLRASFPCIELLRLQVIRIPRLNLLLDQLLQLLVLGAGGLLVSCLVELLQRVLLRLLLIRGLIEHRGRLSPGRGGLGEIVLKLDPVMLVGGLARHRATELLQPAQVFIAVFVLVVPRAYHDLLLLGRGGAVLLQIFQGFHKSWALLLNVSLESVSDEVDVLLSHSLALGRIGLNPGVFLFKFVEVGYIDFAFNLWNVGRFLLSDFFPVDAVEKGVRLNFFHAVDAKSLIGICDESFDEISRRLRQIGIAWDVEDLLPVENLLAGH